MRESAECRIDELLLANNRYVEINRQLKVQLKKDAEQFEFYAGEHFTKAGKFIETGDQVNAKASAMKGQANKLFAHEIYKVLQACSPT